MFTRGYHHQRCLPSLPAGSLGVRTSRGWPAKWERRRSRWPTGPHRAATCRRRVILQPVLARKTTVVCSLSVHNSLRKIWEDFWQRAQAFLEISGLDCCEICRRWSKNQGQKIATLQDLKRTQFVNGMVKLVKVKIYRKAWFSTIDDFHLNQSNFHSATLQEPSSLQAGSGSKACKTAWNGLEKDRQNIAADLLMTGPCSGTGHYLLLKFVKGVSSNPSINQPTNGNLGHLWNHRELSQLWSTRV